MSELECKWNCTMFIKNLLNEHKGVISWRWAYSGLRSYEVSSAKSHDGLYWNFSDGLMSFFFSLFNPKYWFWRQKLGPKCQRLRWLLTLIIDFSFSERAAASFFSRSSSSLRGDLLFSSLLSLSRSRSLSLSLYLPLRSLSLSRSLSRRLRSSLSSLRLGRLRSSLSCVAKRELAPCATLSILRTHLV